MEGTPSGCVNHIVDHHVARPALALSTDSMHIVSGHCITGYVRQSNAQSDHILHLVHLSRSLTRLDTSMPDLTEYHTSLAQ